jgi:hypothetical protein
MTFDSFYAQLYSSRAKINSHTDSYSRWGLTVGVGGSEVFVFGADEIILNTGDVFVADFSQVDHSIKRIMDNSPGWWPNPEEPVEDSKCLTFGRDRCNIYLGNFSLLSSTAKLDDSTSAPE